jgi:hypothetical protein
MGPYVPAHEDVVRSQPGRASGRKPANPKPKPKTREGKKGLVLYVPPEVTLALRKLALENGSDVQRMGWRALELLFAAYGRPLPGNDRPDTIRS